MMPGSNSFLEVASHVLTTASANKTDDYVIATECTAVESPYKLVGDEEVVKSIGKHAPLEPAPIDPAVDKWFYLSGASNL